MPVECNGKTYWRNRRHLRHTPETLEPASGDKTDGNDYIIPMEEQPVVHPQVTNVPEANLPSSHLTNETAKTTAHGWVVKTPKRLIEELWHYRTINAAAIGHSDVICIYIYIVCLHVWL